MSFIGLNLNKDKLMKSTLALLLLLFIPFSGMAQETALPQNYMMEKHGIAEPFYCDLEDPIEEIACMAWDAALGNSHQFPAEQQYEAFQIFIGIEVGQIIQKIVSSPRSSLYVKRLRLTDFPDMVNKELCVLHKHGICGDHQIVFSLVMQFLGIPTRHIGFYYLDNGIKNSHAASEFLVSDKWRYIDITWSSVWFKTKEDIRTMLSLDEILTGNGIRRTNELDMWIRMVEDLANINTFSYLTLPLLGLVKSNTGTIQINISDRTPFGDLPNYVGSNTQFENGITHIWSSTNHDAGAQISVKLDVAGVGGCSSNGPILLDDAGNEYPLEKGSNQITVPNGGSYNVKRDQNEICYIVFSDIAVIK